MKAEAVRRFPASRRAAWISTANNVVWVALGSGHLASFDRKKCKGPLNGPNATGQHCPEGWTLYPTPGPNFVNVEDSGSADSRYYDWVDQFDTLGLGANVPIITGNSSDSLIALVNGKFAVLRVPYPLGFLAKGMNGRVDDPAAGWKGKGLCTTWARELRSTARPARGPQARWCLSRSGRIPWPISPPARFATMESCRLSSTNNIFRRD